MHLHQLSPEQKQKEGNIMQHISKANNLPYTLIQKLSLQISADSVSAVSVIRGWPWPPPKKLEN
jgi:hypothetical protein